MTRKSEGTALLEIEHYKSDNERLVQMLAQTKEFSAFGKLALDTAENTIRYLNPGLAAQELKTKCHTRAPKSALEFKAEAEDWIPEEAFRVAHDFRNRCASTVSQALMNQLLADLNKIWRDREKKSIARVQNNAHREIQYLRRQISFRKPYDQVVHEQDVKRLKKTIKDANTALRENVASIEESNHKGPLEGLALVDSTVKFTNQVLEERRRLQDENE
jgi:hypothetical protein